MALRDLKFARVSSASLATMTMLVLVAAPRSDSCQCNHEFYLIPCTARYGDDVASTPVVFSTPDGTGDPLTEARGYDGQFYDATIYVHLANVYTGAPCVGVPPEDIYLVGYNAPDLAPCAGGMIADAPTDADGNTYFASPFRTGGYTDPGESVLQLFAVFELVYGATVALQINSADITGNGAVDLSDVGVFAQDFYSGYHFRSDFFFDQTLNLSDIGGLTVAIGASCSE